MLTIVKYNTYKYQSSVNNLGMKGSYLWNNSVAIPMPPYTATMFIKDHINCAAGNIFEKKDDSIEYQRRKITVSPQDSVSDHVEIG
jgi:hypothetical protein